MLPAFVDEGTYNTLLMTSLEGGGLLCLTKRKKVRGNL